MSSIVKERLKGQYFYVYKYLYICACIFSWYTHTCIHTYIHTYIYIYLSIRLFLSFSLSHSVFVSLPMFIYTFLPNMRMLLSYGAHASCYNSCLFLVYPFTHVDSSRLAHKNLKNGAALPSPGEATRRVASYSAFHRSLKWLAGKRDRSSGYMNNKGTPL